MRSSDRSPDRNSPQALLLDDQKPVSRIVENWRQSFPEIIGRSQGMLRVLEAVSKVARADSSVLILGESGTGKELIAHAIHRLSPRSHKPYIPLNCSAIPEHLLESELFGHEKGAFTGADKRRLGHFEAASGGTIFLDEIGDMPASLQAKLLRVLQDKKFTMLGGNDTKEVDVRVIAATNKNLEKAVKEQTFRLDLYYRLNVLPVTIPALRDRIDDIPALLEHFIEASNRIQNLSSPCFFTDELLELLLHYSWPGNVRQLQNLVERLIVMKGGGVIDASDLPIELVHQIQEAAHAAHDSSTQQGVTRQVSMPLARPSKVPVQFPQQYGDLPETGMDLQTFIETLENDLIRQALERTGNNRNQAAKLLGLNRTTLVERIKKRKLTTLNEPSKEL